MHHVHKLAELVLPNSQSLSDFQSLAQKGQKPIEILHAEVLKSFLNNLTLHLHGQAEDAVAVLGGKVHHSLVGLFGDVVLIVTKPQSEPRRATLKPL